MKITLWFQKYFFNLKRKERLFKHIFFKVEIISYSEYFRALMTKWILRINGISEWRKINHFVNEYII